VNRYFLLREPILSFDFKNISITFNPAKRKQPMEQKRIPRYYGARIYVTSILLYFFLAMPFIGFIIFQNVPTFMENREGHEGGTPARTDSLGWILDSIPDLNAEQVDSLLALTIQGKVDSLVNLARQPDADSLVALAMRRDIDSLVSKARAMEESRLDTLPAGSGDTLRIGTHRKGQPGIRMFQEKGPFSRYFRLLFLLILVSMLGGWLYNRPFKQFFRKKARKKEISQKLVERCKNRLFRVPLVNSFIIIFPNLVVILYSIIFLVGKVPEEQEVERSMFIQLNYLTLVATLLEFLFAYYWQRHRVYIKYIDHIYTETELRKQVFRGKGGRIRNRLLVASGMTTFLPLVVVLVYLILSLTSIRDLSLTEFSPEQRQILYGPWSKVTNLGKGPSAEGNHSLYYVNAIDTIVMLVGIGNGIIVSFIYLMLFIRWTNRDITGPVKELLIHIRNTRAGEKEEYAIVRTNDEIGELTEGYNEMTEQIHSYVESISAMNRDLEEKIRDRTREVVEQKEEIEAQKEEIEAQLDLATLQRDTIASQKELILDSIRYAERIQSAILPPVQILKKHLTDHFILFKPRDIVSGDYYWAREKDHKLLVAVADCTGHGVPGGFLSMLGISSMNEIVNRSRDLDPAIILEQLREVVIASMHQTGSRDEAQDGIEIALCILDQKKGTLDYAGANRPLYLVRDGAVQQFKPDRMPIGIYEQDPVPFTSHRIKLKKRDSIYLFSDGYVDQLGGPHRKTFRVVNFRKLLLDIQDHSMEKQKAILIDRMAGWQGMVEQIDDILVMGIRI
jgi:serine phosphatase RsbU (regulator of sigma subunit)